LPRTHKSVNFIQRPSRQRNKMPANLRLVETRSHDQGRNRLRGNCEYRIRLDGWDPRRCGAAWIYKFVCTGCNRFVLRCQAHRDEFDPASPCYIPGESQGLPYVAPEGGDNRTPSWWNAGGSRDNTPFRLRDLFRQENRDQDRRRGRRPRDVG
jgi:hypothetical protein